jgi:hypothetical protein
MIWNSVLRLLTESVSAAEKKDIWEGIAHMTQRIRTINQITIRNGSMENAFNCGKEGHMAKD